MKLKLLYSILFLAALFVIGPKVSLEAGHRHNHFSFNVGTVFSGYQRAHTVERYRPSYVEEQYYYSPYGYSPYGYFPYEETVTVYRSPRPAVREVYVYPPSPPVFGGFSFGFNFR
jgi:hypothetical protein